MIDIERMTPGSPPAGFTFARTGKGPEGQWTVVEDPTASMGRAIEQSNTDRTDYRFPLAIHDSLSAANLDVELRFKAVGGKVDQAGGIALLSSVRLKANALGRMKKSASVSSGPSR